MARVHVCSVTELPSGESLRVDTQPAVALFHVGEDFYAVADLCTHATASISEGYLDDHDSTVECPIHTARFCLKTGAALCQPATEPLQTFPVVVEDGEIYLDMPEEAA
ncbi:3-phenylpropionate/trans-cinnamate dioxygenase ferredoxin subunit [Azomonas agilis]|uniref:3-phenylpropionate/trans-cinnamate dioxygenase ferredoxin subunit n=1 Tax=Azomonas agilis TaxID=116849 RepID=A0A562IYS6_9GAMM|nr:3-phenylpropionate/cinnamic acid dioxygenase ferredoxin subunit [Azomonas agilis]TWH76013.1 3-phenylpropionate/trans-cinnamate dioxygenase ferredoxin subunit [Azomonas agilis]